MTFGTTFTDTRAKTIDAVEAAIQKAHPDVPVFEAYTSHIIIDRVKAKEGIQKMTPEEAFKKLQDEGYTRVAVVSRRHQDAGSAFQEDLPRYPTDVLPGHRRRTGSGR